MAVEATTPAPSSQRLALGKSLRLGQASLLLEKVRFAANQVAVQAVLLEGGKATPHLLKLHEEVDLGPCRFTLQQVLFGGDDTLAAFTLTA